MFDAAGWHLPRPQPPHYEPTVVEVLLGLSMTMAILALICWAVVLLHP